MEIVRLILIVIVVIIFTVVIYNLLNERSALIKEQAQKNIEGMSVSDKVADVFSSTVKLSIQNSKVNKLLSVSQYCIKGSYNSAYTGKIISSDAIKYVLSRGCRVIDLQIHYSFDDSIPYVGNITDPEGVDMESQNRISLYNIFTTILVNAFTPTQGEDGCPNPKDPLIIHMRVIPDRRDTRSILDMSADEKSKSNKSCLVYESIAKCIDQVFPKEKRLVNFDGNAVRIDSNNRDNLNIAPVNSNMNNIVREIISQKVLFLMDVRNNREYSYNSSAFLNMINGETGGDTIQLHEYGKLPGKNPPIIKDSGFETNIREEKMVIPDILGEHPPPSIIETVLNHGVQVTLYPFYIKKKEVLHQYEELFNHYGSAIIPMAYAIQYLEELRTYLSNKQLHLGPF
jgi:hypothetical protein